MCFSWCIAIAHDVECPYSTESDCDVFTGSLSSSCAYSVYSSQLFFADAQVFQRTGMGLHRKPITLLHLPRTLIRPFLSVPNIHDPLFVNRAPLLKHEINAAYNFT